MERGFKALTVSNDVVLKIALLFHVYLSTPHHSLVQRLSSHSPEVCRLIADFKVAMGLNVHLSLCLNFVYKHILFVLFR